MRRAMTTIDSRAATKVQPELMSGESVFWAGMPNPKVIFHSDDWAAVPFSLLWTGFFVFWEGTVLGYWGNGARRGSPSWFMVAWGIPFLVIGQYIVWGRFFHDAWLKRRTYYAVTSRRVLIFQEGWKRRTNWVFLESIPMIECEGTARGTLWFGKKYPIVVERRSKRKTRNLSRFAMDEVPVFADVDDVEGVQQLVQELREKAKKESNSANANGPDPLSYTQDS